MRCQKLSPQMSSRRWDNLNCTRSIALFSNRVEKSSDPWTNLPAPFLIHSTSARKAGCPGLDVGHGHTKLYCFSLICPGCRLR